MCACSDPCSLERIAGRGTRGQVKMPERQSSSLMEITSGSEGGNCRFQTLNLSMIFMDLAVA